MGSIGFSNEVDYIIKAIYELNLQGIGKDKVVLRIYGDGPLKYKIYKLIKSLKIKNIILNNAVASNSIEKISESADAFIFAMLDLQSVYRYGISFNKIFEYMSLSKPIIYNTYTYFNPLYLSIK